MKTSLFNIIRKQKKLVNSFIFLISWSQIHAQANHLFLTKEERQPENKEYKSIVSKNPKFTFSSVEKSLPDASEPSPEVSGNKDKVASQSEVFSKSINIERTTFNANYTNSSRYYISDIKQGVIGKDEAHPIDQVYDNIFTVIVDNAVKSNSSAWLEYELYGVTHSSGVSKYINDELATGGNAVEKNNQWTFHSEALSASSIIQGKNKVTFTIPSEADYTYKVRNVRIRIDKSIPAFYKPEKTAASALIKNIAAGAAGELHWEGAGLEFNKGTLKTSKNFSVTPLRDIDIPATTPEFVNVTKEHFAYRFLPHGEHFSIPAKVTMAYDKSRIPTGYTEQDIKAFYFDDIQKKWMALEKDSLMAEKQILVSKTTHFTDMVAGIIKVPESPETGSYAPNSIKDIKAADPSAGIVSIGAPSPNNMGTVNTSFPIKLPAGRQGMQPSLSVNYNSEGGNGWMGLGWDLSVPAISIDTRWGVPRYDGAKETEIYSFGSEQLTFKDGDKFVLPNRTEGFDKDRMAERQFYPRIEGAYNKIIRHGSSPSNYWWEVISKDGTRNLFGGDGTAVVENAVLRQEGTNNIGHWALYKTIDTNGNYVKYNYDTPKYSASGAIGNGGKEMYISTIEYTLNDANNSLKKYTVNFGYDTAQRDDVQVDGRLGFVRVTSKRLGNIQIFYDGNNKVRSYEFKYKTGAFTKSLLETITEKKADDQVFYTNRVEYFNNIETSQYAPETTIDGVANDAGIKSSSLLGHGDSKNNTVGGALTFGLAKVGDTQAYNPLTKSATIGGDYQYTEGEGGGRLTITDVDGDGLPDKILKNEWSSPDATFKYRKKGPDTDAFGSNLLTPENSKSFSYSKSYTNSFGLEATASALFQVGASGGTSKTKDLTYNYFTDANSDGIQDIVSNGQVYFGRVENGVLKYSSDVSLTPNPIMKGAAISTPAVDCNEILEDYKNSPLHDVVKAWRAPFDGMIGISGSMKLKNPSSSPDGVKISVQHFKPETNTSNFLTPFTILSGATSSANISQSSLQVKQGDYLYFRVNSRDNGVGDLIEMVAGITYLSTPISYPYPGALSDWYRDSSETPLGRMDNVSLVSSKNGTGVPVNAASGTITGTFNKPLTVQDITVKIVKKQSDGTVTTIGSQQYPSTTTGSQTLQFNTGALTENDIVYFQVQSNLNEKWENLKFNNLKLTINYEGNDIELPIIPDFQFYNLRNNTTATFKPWIDMRGRDGNYSLYAKLTGKPAGRYTYIVRNRVMQRGNFVNPIITTINWTGSVNSMQELSISQPIIRWNDYYVECYTDLTSDAGLDGTIPNMEVEIRESVNVNPAAPTVFETHGINVYGKDTDKIYKEGSGTDLSTDNGRFGAMYRSWGQFIYHGGYGTLPTACSQLQDQLTDYGSQQIDPVKLVPPSDENDSTPLNSRLFIMMNAYNGRDFNTPGNSDYVQRYIGMSKTTYVQGIDISSSRMGMNDMSLLSQATSANTPGVFNAPVKQSKTTNTNTGISGGFSVFSLNKTTSTGKTINMLDYFDMNGDGYPDVLNGNMIQYTNMIGMLASNTLLGANDNSHRTDHSNSGFGVGQNYPLSGKSNESSNKNALKAVEPGFNFSGGSSDGEDHSNYSYIDINGDGLLDRVAESGQVQLNLGYSYAPAENLSYGNFRNGTTTSTNLGAGASIGGTITSGLPKGVSMFNGSIAFGAGKSETFTDQKTSLIDINNDGLADLVTNSGGNLSVQINTGNKFVSIPWNASSNIQQDISRGFNMNVGVTASILIPLGTTGNSLKISINPSTSFGEGDSNVKQQILDLNGDGFPDLLKSQADGDGNFSNTSAQVQYSTIGTTNLLKKVTTPMGGTWEVSYERTGNTYDLPQNKWIMTSVVSNDGFTGDSQFKPDFSKITVTYENPYHSRRERTFYGFEKVRTNQINTGNGGAAATEIYRYTLQTFNNSSYFLKGALLSEVLYDAAGNKWTEKINTLSLRTINNSTIALANVLTKEAEKGLTNFGYFTALDKTTYSFYEGQAVAGKSTSTEMVYDNYGNLKQNKDLGDIQIGVNEVLTSDVTYQITDNVSNYLILPTSVKSTAPGVVRERTAQYDGKGNVTAITMVGPGNPVNNYEYDSYGNIKKATGPANYQGQRFFHEYTYDANVATYPTKVKDAFGYSSTSEYDFRFGVPVFTEDMNLQPTQYAYDAAGRTTEITGPYEMFNDIPWTIQFEYKPITDAPLNATGAQSYAITRHYDPDNANNTINTVSISDGLGSPIQVKKTADLYQKGLKYVVSGKAEQDAFGRALKTYYPTESQASVNTYDATVDNIVPTINTYDVLDRVLTTKLPDEDLISEVEYGFGNDREGRKMFRTMMTDELGTIKTTYADIKGRTTTVHEPSNTGDIFTSFTHDAIGELLKVRDVQNNLTTSIYDDLGRRTSMTHPDNGTSTFVYDPASNMTSRTNAENETAAYEYDYKRLKAINYPKYPENNVKYYYGQAMDASAMDNNAVGRLWYQTDATGTQYLKYGRLGELTHQRRSVAAPGAGVYWFGTEWEYDTWNRVKTITYPDGEKVTYNYNLAGNLRNMASVKDGFARNIINELGYDKFDQRVFLKYGNGTTTSYEYETKRRRLLKLNAQTPTNRYFMKNLYQYDVVSNVLQIHNNAPVSQAGLLGGGTNHAYGYDDLYRLTSASGNWRGMNPQGQEERQRYTVTMAYDNMHNVMSKTQKHERAMGSTGTVWNNIEATSYLLNYRYEGTKPHAPTTIVDEPNVSGALCCDVNNPQVKFQNYTYDKKGNPTAIAQQTCNATEPKTKYLWDEENRMRFVDTNPSTPEVDGSAIYTYDAGGERIIKNVLSTAVITGSNGTSQTITKNDYSLYPNGMAVARLIFNTQTQKYELSYTKHYYAGDQRVNSKLGKGKDVGLFNCAWLIIPYGTGVSSINEKAVAKEKLEANTSASLAIMAANGITPPPNYGQNAGYTENCVPSYAGVEEKDTYWYHPDHLGSSSFITGLDGEVTQNIEYFPSGELFVENHKNSYNTPYKFNGKEQDDETGYYYYGARYYNPRVSLWLNVDPLADYNPLYNDQAYIDGEHNGGVYNSGNNNPYIYCYQNPIKYIDPNGKQVEWQKAWNNTKTFLSDAGDVLHKTAENITPLNVHVKSQQEIAASKAKYGEGIIASLDETWDNFKGVGNQLRALGDIDFDDVKERFNNASGKEKVEIAATAGAILFSLKKGKIDTKGLALLGSSGKNFKILTANLLKKAGIDAHELKYEFLGKKTKISEYDLYKHTDTNEVLILKKGGKGEPIHTGEYIND
ncbi:SpvB/TcaC N-terminal domain-containing protein [Chryseobacterium jejuense]|uniref:SpvB/TcaC N-terminal domain-containing protein n=1 Tax=Chryseobacterium jejuense TaxID=445960 RepID=UPI001AE33EB2|nr:SpvB/TcaC N-terminal domain-containing protein [Chryseobacterium jejuense]MBP2619252.1 RHS repeat-associated protein [Chryseobacterium jejuense]